MSSKYKFSQDWLNIILRSRTRISGKISYLSYFYFSTARLPVCTANLIIRQRSFLFLCFSICCRLANRAKFIHKFFLLHKHTHAQKIWRIHKRYQRFTRQNIRTHNEYTTMRAVQKERRGEAQKRGKKRKRRWRWVIDFLDVT